MEHDRYYTHAETTTVHEGIEHDVRLAFLYLILMLVGGVLGTWLGTYHSERFLFHTLFGLENMFSENTMQTIRTVAGGISGGATGATIAGTVHVCVR